LGIVILAKHLLYPSQCKLWITRSVKATWSIRVKKSPNCFHRIDRLRCLCIRGQIITIARCDAFDSVDNRIPSRSISERTLTVSIAEHLGRFLPHGIQHVRAHLTTDIRCPIDRIDQLTQPGAIVSEDA